MDEEVVPPVDVPLAALSPEAQEGVIDEFIHREGTDYGSVEASMNKKRADIRRQMDKGLVKLIYDVTSESVTLVKVHGK